MQPPGSRPPGVSLGGASARALTKEAVLAQAAAERAVRSEARRQQRAATAIQAAWRGSSARTRVRDERLAAWVEEFGSAAPDAPALPREHVQRGVRLLLAALLPPPSSAARRALEAGRALPLQGRPVQRRALAAATNLLTRSLKSSDPSAHYLTSGGLGDTSTGAALVQQVTRLCLLCAATLGAGEAPDRVLDAATARLLELLLLPQQQPGGRATVAPNGSSGGSGVDALQGARRMVLSAVVQHPLPLLAAAKRIAARAVNQQDAHGSGSSSQLSGQQLPASISDTAGEMRVPCSDSTFQVACFQRGPWPPMDPCHLPKQRPPPTLHTPVLSRLFSLAITLVETEEQQQQQPCTALFVQRLLSAPGITAVLPSAVCDRLLRPSTLRALLAAAGFGAVPFGAGAAALLGNLSQLLLGKPGAPPAGDASSLLKLPASPHLADRGTAVAMCIAAHSLLPAIGGGASSGKQRLSQPQAAVVQAQLVLLGAQAPLLQLLAVLKDDMPLFAGLALHLLLDLPRADSLLASAREPIGGGASGVEGASQLASGAAVAAAVLNTLAFAPQVLPVLWKWLSLNLGLPLEAPAAARLGLDVASVAGGCRQLAPQHALVLGVFCRCVVAFGWLAAAWSVLEGDAKGCQSLGLVRNP
jgi:hypothetical protein